MIQKEIVLRGFPICSGIAIGSPFFFCEAKEMIPEISIPNDQIDAEVARYYRALKNSRRDLIVLQKKLKAEGGGEAVAILHAHLEMMRDPMMTIDVEKEIRRRGKNTEFAFKTVIIGYEKKFSKITDSFFQERMKDFQDISRRIIAHLQQQDPHTLGKIEQRSIVFAHELSPSDTAEANADFIEAFVTRSGSETSHVAIMARAKGIPFVSKVQFPDLNEQEIRCVIVDGQTGDVILNPTSETINRYQKERQQLHHVAHELLKEGALEAQTKEGCKIRLSVNLESFDEIESLHTYGGEGVGLFRSEYLFLAKGSFPAEEEQFAVYKALGEQVGKHRAIIRTFDIGGDKLVNLYPTRFEKNPYLGCRAIRLMLKEKIVFKTQIRAILRASAFGEIGMLFPMISGLEELREAMQLVREVQSELSERGIPFNTHLPVGCMIEVPSAALIVDLIAKECDFLSIGTNDLVQYALAVDRGNPAMSYLYNPAHPCILRMIKTIVSVGKAQGKSVSVCGEIAADPRFTPLLIGLGVQEFSVAPSSIAIIKNVMRRLSIVGADALAEKALQMSDSESIERLLETYYQRKDIE